MKENLDYNNLNSAYSNYDEKLEHYESNKSDFDMKLVKVEYGLIDCEGLVENQGNKLNQIDHVLSKNSLKTI